MLGNDGASAFGRVLDNNLKLQSNLTVLEFVACSAWESTARGGLLS